MTEIKILTIDTRKRYSVGRSNASSTWAVLHYFANLLSWLSLRVARIALGPGALSGSKMLKQFLFRRNRLAGVLYGLTESKGHIVLYSIFVHSCGCKFTTQS